jgi:hypothetical protein
MFGFDLAQIEYALSISRYSRIKKNIRKSKSTRTKRYQIFNVEEKCQQK